MRKINWRTLYRVATFTLLVFTLTLTYRIFSLEKSSALKEEAPFLSYAFDEDHQAFVINTEEDVSVLSVRWFFPYTNDSFREYQKNSNSLTIAEIISNLHLSLFDRQIFIPSHAADYLRCEILNRFDEGQAEMEENNGFLIAAETHYLRKGENSTAVLDILLINEFEDIAPQIRLIYRNPTEESLEEYMKKGNERLNEILDIAPSYNPKENYRGDFGVCSSSSKFFKVHSFSS